MKTDRYGFTVQEDKKNKIFTLIFYPLNIRQGETFGYQNEETRVSAFKHALEFGVAHIHNNILYQQLMQGIDNG